MDYATLQNEIANDPASLGYAPYRNRIGGIDADGKPIPDPAYNPTEIARRLNAAPASALSERPRVAATLIRAAISAADWALLTAIERSYVDFLTAHDEIPGRIGRVAEELIGPNGIWRANPVRAFDSRGRLVAVLMHQGTRAEELFGDGVVVRWEHVDTALRS